jgi:hypothetical protein
MNYPNDYAGFYPASSAREEFNEYQFLGQASATEDANTQWMCNTFADSWGTYEQPGPTARSSTTLPATTGYGKHCCNLFADWCLTLESLESLAPATSYTNQADGYGQPSYYLPEVGQQAQTYNSGALSQGFSSARMVAPEPFTAVPTLSSGKSLFSPQLRALEYLPITDSPVRLLGGNPERTLYQHVQYSKYWNSFILIQSR